VLSTNGALSFSARVSHFSSSAGHRSGGRRMAKHIQQPLVSSRSGLPVRSQIIDTWQAPRKRPRPHRITRINAIQGQSHRGRSSKPLCQKSVCLGKCRNEEMISSANQLALLDDSAAPDWSSLGSKLEAVKIAKVESLFRHLQPGS